MLRGLVLVLLLANGLFFLWSQGHLASLGLAPIDEREPERLSQQLTPDAVVLLNPPAPALAAVEPAIAPAVDVPSPAPAPSSAETDTPVACWKLDGLSSEQAEVWKARLGEQGLPSSAWSLTELPGNGRWIIYMGRYDAAQLARKTGELDRLKLSYQELRAGPWAFGVSLGSFASEEAAQQGLVALRPKGVRTARIQPERPDLSQFNLRIPALTAAQKAALPANGQRLQACN
jgi:hypothetical protein